MFLQPTFILHPMGKKKRLELTRIEMYAKGKRQLVLVHTTPAPNIFHLTARSCFLLLVNSLP
jgi:hypothetical protein